MSGTTAVVVFARYDSRRLPGKVLLPIAGRAMLGRVLDRLRRIECSCELIVATSDRPVDDPVAEFCSQEDVDCFRGAAEDVAGRALVCAEGAGASRFVRISGDSPFIDPDLVTRMLSLHKVECPEITTNLYPRTYPPGLSVEIVEMAAMRRMVKEVASPDDREHVTSHIYKHPERFVIRNHAAADRPSDGLSLVVDTETDLRKADWITSRLGDRPETAAIGRVLELARRWPGASAGAIS